MASMVIAMATLCEIPTKIIRLYLITDGICPSVIMAWVVIVWQLSVKYRRNLSVGKAVSMYLKYI
jgi:hypothetical protein